MGFRGFAHTKGTALRSKPVRRGGVTCRRRVARRAVAAWSAVLVAITGAVMAPSPSGAATGTLLGPVLSRVETPTVSLGRDGGFSVPLPNGTDFWVFADSPRFDYKQGGWHLTSFIPGSTAGVAAYTPGQPLNRPLIEVRPGSRVSPPNQPAQFMATPSGAYMPGRPGKACNKANGKPSTNAVRWPSGLALMPDKTNILVPYVIACVVSPFAFQGEGWGFALFNWRTQKFSQKPYDVFRPKSDGSALPSLQSFGSPIIVGKRVTFYSWVCCSAGSGVYSTTFDLSLAALKNRASYKPKIMPSVAGTFDLNVAQKSGKHSRFTMYNLRGNKGQYDIYAASAPTGPWSKVASGGVPRCDTSPYPCHSFALHPELSPASRLTVSYHLPGYGPGNPSKHPYPHEPLRHVVQSSIPCTC
jgi:hypothetical protein